MNPNDLHIAEVNANRQSSIHKHDKLYNFILNIYGSLYISFPDDDFQAHIPEWNAIEIAPEVVHRFYTTETTIILESYYEQPLRSLSYYDIERFPNA